MLTTPAERKYRIQSTCIRYGVFELHVVNRILSRKKYIILCLSHAQVSMERPVVMYQVSSYHEKQRVRARMLELLLGSVQGSTRYLIRSTDASAIFAAQ